MHPVFSLSTLSEAAQHLDHGGCVAMPTETVYGLAARIDRPQGIESIFRIKQRPSFDPLIVHVASIDDAKKVAGEWSPVADKLAKAFWPGPLTLVVRKPSSLNPMITSGLETVGLRMPRHDVALALLKLSGPLAAPSANRFGHTSPTTVAHVASEFPDQLAALRFLDGGACDVGVESTVCLVTDQGVQILRPGGITREELAKHVPVSAKETSKEQASPGHLLHHYMPVKPLVVIWNRALSELSKVEMEAIRSLSALQGAAPQFIELQLPTDAASAARLLYARLREADSGSGNTLFLTRTKGQTSGLWEAIDDRLQRAAALTFP